MEFWADYSAGYPGAASLAAAGFSGAIRYIGKGTEGKQLQAAERADFDAHRFSYLLVCELDTHDAEGGYETGKAFGQIALADARAQGVPDSVGIACAADEHLAASLIPTAVEYVRGFADVVGRARCGAYGFPEFVSAVHAAGHASWYWQAGNPPSVTGTSGFVNFWQRNGYDRQPTTSYVNGVQCDINVKLGEDVTPEDIQAVAKAVWDCPLSRDGQEPARAETYLTYDNSKSGAAETAAEAANAKLDTLTAAVAALAAKPAAVFTAVQLDDVKAALVAAVHTAGTAVSPTDRTAIATAVVEALRAKLAA